MRKPAFCICENKDTEVTAKLISTFVFARRIVQSLYFLNTKLQASSHLLWQYSLIYVQPGQKPRFSHNEAHICIMTVPTKQTKCMFLFMSRKHRIVLFLKNKKLRLYLMCDFSSLITVFLKIFSN